MDTVYSFVAYFWKCGKERLRCVVVEYIQKRVVHMAQVTIVSGVMVMPANFNIACNPSALWTAILKTPYGSVPPYVVRSVSEGRDAGRDHV